MTKYDIRDNCLGKVTGHGYGGAFIMLESGETAFAPSGFSLPTNARVLCTVVCNAAENKWMLVNIDSVCETERYA